MPIIFYGAKETPVDIGEMMIKCPHCEADHMADVMIISKYYHIYWIPVFPFEKLAATTCQKCGMFRSGLYFNNKLVSNYEEIKKKFRHPWFTYTGIALFASPFVIAIILHLFHAS